MSIKATYMATLPDGYEWNFLKIGDVYGLFGTSTDKPLICYRLDGLSLVPCELKVDENYMVCET